MTLDVALSANGISRRQVAKVALDAGISQATVSQVYVHGPNETPDVVKVEISIPNATTFVEDLMPAEFFNPHDYGISSQTLPCLVSWDKPSKLTVPMRMVSVDPGRGQRGGTDGWALAVRPVQLTTREL